MTTGEPEIDTVESLADLAELASLCAEELGPAIGRAVSIIIGSLEHNGKILVCGNGGSAADAQHFVAELVGRFSEGAAPLAAISLSSDPSITTAVSNDFGFQDLFARQIEAIGNTEDVAIVISTSGRSANIVGAVTAAQRKQMTTIALLGKAGDPLLESCDGTIRIPSENPQRIQEIHTAVLHAICAGLEEYRGAKS